MDCQYLLMCSGKSDSVGFSDMSECASLCRAYCALVTIACIIVTSDQNYPLVGPKFLLNGRPAIM